MYIMSEIKNIIFDFGVVIINIDPSAVKKRMAEKGIHNVDELHQRLIKQNIYNDLETGKIGPDEFRAAIKEIVDVAVSDEDIDDAWNSMLLDIPRERIKFLTRLKSKYKVYLLSNTNAIHWKYYDRYFQDNFDYPSLSTFFTEAWYSYLMGVRKPDPAIFEMVLEQGKLHPSETAFVDDILENVDSAATIGIHPVHLPAGTEIMDLFDENLLLI
jgi:epoxide hydrolase-like predicted phosphatase